MIPESQDRDEWLAERRTGIGGSDVAPILGLSPWATPLDIYRDKLGLAAPVEETWPMRWGSMIEPHLRQIYADMTGRDVLVHTGVLRHPDHSYMIASLDGLTNDGRVVEFKTSRTTQGWGEPGTDEIPEHYMLQVQHYLLVTGAEVADVLFALLGDEPVLYQVRPDKTLHASLIDVEREFWARVMSRTPPDPVTVAEAQQRWGRKSEARKVVADASAMEAYDLLLNTRAAIAAHQATEEACKARLMRALEESDTLVDPRGRTLVTWKAAKPAMRFDAKAFQSQHKDLYESYLKPGEPNRRFLIKE